MLEAHTFARDAKSANTWITNQSGNLTDPPETATLDHIEALLKKFENFERAINAQADRFDAFKNKTRVSVMNANEFSKLFIFSTF